LTRYPHCHDRSRPALDYTFWIELVLFVVLLGLSAFFSSSET
jgi:hypothetical protein